MRRPLLLIFPAYCVGILLADYLPLPLWLLFLWGAAGAFAVAWAVYRQWLVTPYLIMGAVILAGLVRMSAMSALPEQFIAHYVQEAPVRIEGIVDTVLGSWAEGPEKVRTVYVVDVKQVVNLSGRCAAEGKIRLTVRQAKGQQLCQTGDRIAVKGKIQLPNPGSNPGELDYRTYFLRHGIGAVMSITGEDMKITGSVAGYYPLRKMYQLRQSLSNAMTRQMGPTESAMLQGLVFGERTAIPAQIEWNFADTGLVHILSVSGYHVALIAGAIYQMLRLLNCSEVVMAKVTMLCIGGYVLLVGFSPPVLRSAIMALVLWGAVLLLRKKDALQALLVAGWVLLLWDPRQIYDLGFQLSFAATTGLIVLSPGLSGLCGKKMPVWASTVISATVAATLAVIPMLAGYFQQCSLISLPANILLTYPVSLLIISGMLAALVGSIWAPLAYSIIMFNNWLTGLIIHAANFLAKIPFAAIHLPVFPWWLAIIYYLLLAWVFRLYTPCLLPDFLHIWQNQRKRLFFLGICVVAVGGWYWYAGWGQGLVVTFLNVGQGDAAFIRTPHGHSVLIDGGGGLRQDGTGYDAGEKIIMPFLRRAGVRSLDLVILSHGHEDHAGGLRTILQYMPVKGIVSLTDKSTTRQIAELFDICRVRDIPVYQAEQGLNIDIDGVSIAVLAPNGLSGKSEKENEASVVFQVSYKAHRFLFTGDLEGAAEQNLLQEEKLASTVLKVGHHGSSRGTSSAFLRKVKPDFAVISVGAKNSYGHPDRGVLQRLQEQHVQVYRTDQDGAVVFWSDGQRIKVQTYLSKQSN